MSNKAENPECSKQVQAQLAEIRVALGEIYRLGGKGELMIAVDGDRITDMTVTVHEGQLPGPARRTRRGRVTDQTQRSVFHVS